MKFKKRKYYTIIATSIIACGLVCPVAYFASTYNYSGKENKVVFKKPELNFGTNDNSIDIYNHNVIKEYFNYYVDSITFINCKNEQKINYFLKTYPTNKLNISNVLNENNSNTFSINSNKDNNKFQSSVLNVLYKTNIDFGLSENKFKFNYLDRVDNNYFYYYSTIYFDYDGTIHYSFENKNILKLESISSLPIRKIIMIEYPINTDKNILIDLLYEKNAIYSSNINLRQNGSYNSFVIDPIGLIVSSQLSTNNVNLPIFKIMVSK